jgi:hypothetical protein
MCANLQTTVAQGSLTTPAGFTSAGSTGAALDGGTGFVNTYLYWKVAVSADTSASSYNVSYNTGGTFGDIAGNIRAYHGTAASSPINSSAFVLTSGTVQTNVVPALTETFASGEIYVGCAATDINLGNPTTTPTLSHTFGPAPFIIQINMGDYFPGSTPGTETYDYGAGNNVAGRTGWGVSIKPLAGGAPKRPPLYPFLVPGSRP